MVCYRLLVLVVLSTPVNAGDPFTQRQHPCMSLRTAVAVTELNFVLASKHGDDPTPAPVPSPSTPATPGCGRGLQNDLSRATLASNTANGFLPKHQPRKLGPKCGQDMKGYKDGRSEDWDGQYGCCGNEAPEASERDECFKAGMKCDEGYKVVASSSTCVLDPTPAPVLPASPSVSNSFKVLGYNTHLMEGVGGLFDFFAPQLNDLERAHELIAFITNSGAHVIGLSEVWTNEMKRSFMADLSVKYPHSCWDENTNKLQMGSGLLLLSQTPLTSCNFVKFATLVGSDALSDKGVLSVTTTDPTTNKQVIVVLTHMQADGNADARLARATNAAQLLATIKKADPTFSIPAILIGDLNIVGESSEYNSFGNSMRSVEMVDAYRYIYPSEVQHPGFTYDGTRNALIREFAPGDINTRQRLDYSYVRGATPTQFEIHRTQMSDHDGFSVTYALLSTDPPTPTPPPSIPSPSTPTPPPPTPTHPPTPTPPTPPPPTPPPPTPTPQCCNANSAHCKACQQGVTVAEFCHAERMGGLRFGSSAADSSGTNSASGSHSKRDGKIALGIGLGLGFLFLLSAAAFDMAHGATYFGALPRSAIPAAAAPSEKPGAPPVPFAATEKNLA